MSPPPPAPVTPACPPAGSDADCSLLALRARGAHRVDPVHFRFLEVLARRAAAQPGEAGRLLKQRLAQLTAAYGRRAGGVMSVPDPAVRRPWASALQPAATVVPNPGGPLAELVRHIDRQQAPPGAVRPPAGPGEATGTAGAPAELKAMRDFRSTWSRLRVERQLQQSRAKVPANAGPLHSERLVLRALQAMQRLSPAYLGRFMAQVDALLWLEAVHSQAGAGTGTGDAARANAEKKRKPARGKAAG